MLVADLNGKEDLATFHKFSPAGNRLPDSGAEYKKLRSILFLQTHEISQLWRGCRLFAGGQSAFKTSCNHVSCQQIQNFYFCRIIYAYLEDFSKSLPFCLLWRNLWRRQV